MDDAQLRRHLSAPRALVLDILGAEGHADNTQILHAWIERKPTMTEGIGVDCRGWSGKSCGVIR